MLHDGICMYLSISEMSIYVSMSCDGICMYLSIGFVKCCEIDYVGVGCICVAKFDHISQYHLCR